MSKVANNIPFCRVLHLSAVDHGGAGSAARNLHQAMRDRGIPSTLAIWNGRYGGEGIITLACAGVAGLGRLAGRAWYRLTSKRRYLFRDQSRRCVSLSRLFDLVDRVRPNLIVVHYISDFLAFADVLALHERSKALIVFNLLDMGLFTGGCHYAWGCDRYRDGCGACPALPARSRRDASFKVLAEKVEATRTMKHVVVVPSTQLRNEVQGASVFAETAIYIIPIGVDPFQLGQTDKALARAQLDVPANDLVLFFGAQDVMDPRKGMALLIEALRDIATQRGVSEQAITLLIAGRTEGLRDLDKIGLGIRSLGYVDKETLAKAYCAADFFVCPSIEDSGPMMVNEAMMSGTPVIGFPSGVLPDLVIDGKTGVLADRTDSVSLSIAISRGLSWDDQVRARASAACRALALERCSLDTQVAGFVRLAVPLSTTTTDTNGSYSPRLKDDM